MYHSDANKATRNAKPAVKAKPAKAKMPGGSTRAKVEKSFNKTKAINNFVGPGGSRTREDLKRSESEYNSTTSKPRRSRLTTAQRRRARRGGRG